MPKALFWNKWRNKISGALQLLTNVHPKMAIKIVCMFKQKVHEANYVYNTVEQSLVHTTSARVHGLWTVTAHEHGCQK